MDDRHPVRRGQNPAYRLAQIMWMWRSLVARFLAKEKVAGPNPVIRSEIWRPEAAGVG